MIIIFIILRLIPRITCTVEFSQKSIVEPLDGNFVYIPRVFFLAVSNPSDRMLPSYHRQKYFWLLNFNRLLQPKVKLYVTYFFKVRMFYERFKSEQHLKKDRTTKGRGLEFLRR